MDNRKVSTHTLFQFNQESSKVENLESAAIHLTLNQQEEQPKPTHLMLLNSNNTIEETQSHLSILYEKNTELEHKNESLKKLLEHTENEQIEIINELKQLKSVDEELTFQIENLKKTIKDIDNHTDSLEKKTLLLGHHSDQLKETNILLDQRTQQLENKTEQLSFQLMAHLQIGRHHFNTMIMMLSLVSILTLIALLYAFMQQQYGLQSSIDKDSVIEQRIDRQLLKQEVQLIDVKQQHKQLNKNIEGLQIQLTNMDTSLPLLHHNSDRFDHHTTDDARNILHTSDWLAQLPSDHYAIQLISVDSKQKLYHYIKKQGYSLEDDIAWFTIQFNGRDYYVLTYGNFTDLSQVRAIFAQLPRSVIQKSPGISRMKDIQRFIF
jgi:hypothetical protein